jgi:hypothetical protein
VKEMEEVMRRKRKKKRIRGDGRGLGRNKQQDEGGREGRGDLKEKNVNVEGRERKVRGE